MTDYIKPNRLSVDDRFSVLGFTINTAESPKWFEVALATDPQLFRADSKAQRTSSNFYTNRGQGPLLVERGEAVYLIPPEVLRNFIGQQKLYYALATFADPGGGQPAVVSIPTENSPWIDLRGFSGRSLRRGMSLPRGNGAGGSYGGGQGGNEWAGDAAQPGTQSASPPPAGRNGSASPPAAPGGPNGAPAAGQAYQSAPLGYDDGFGEWAEPMEATAAEQAEDEAHGIEGPIPDFGAAAEQQSVSRSLTASEYPQASRFVPAAPGNYRVSGSQRTINRVVIHITDGAANINGTISWFQNPAAQVSAHYVVGQDGEVVQMVMHNDVAWHAGRANSDSIGIEHVANTHGLRPTAAEYCASAALVRWLCDTYSIPIDRQHILGHSEADPRTTHTSCPNAVWNWDYFMEMVTTATCIEPPASLSLGAESFDFNWGDVELVPQLTGLSCWAAAAAMVVGWREYISINPDEIARGAGRWAEYNVGLNPENRRDLASAWRLVMEPPQSYSVEGFRQLLVNNGPLWVGVAVPFGHAVVVTGIYGDGTLDGTYLNINDPLPQGQGARTTRTFRQFAREYEDRMTVDAEGNINVQVLHANGRRPVSGAQAYTAGRYGNGNGDGNGQRPVGAQAYAEGQPPGAAYRSPVRASRQFAVVEIASAIVGATMTRILDNEGDISWELDQLQGLKHPDNNAANQGSASFSTQTITVAGPRGSTVVGVDHIYADAEITFQHNGSSLGNVQISVTRANDAVGAGLVVKANIMDDANAYSRPPNTQRFAAVKVRFHYRFTNSVWADMIAITDLVLYGDGTVSRVHRWTQTP